MIVSKMVEEMYLNNRWGFLRETTKLATKDGIDKDTGVPRTGLDEYIKVIFPDIDDWIHNKTTGLLKDDGKKSLIRPDYRSETLKLIIEFDGLQHYTLPDRIIKDYENQKFYERYGYKVVRIPYFIQLTNSVVETLFGIKVSEQLFDNSIPSFSIRPSVNNTPAYLCPAGIRRMAREFTLFPEQYSVNINYLRSCDSDAYTEYKILEIEYNSSLNKE